MSAQIIVGVSNHIKNTDQADHKAEFVNKTHELVCSILQQETLKNVTTMVQAGAGSEILQDARKVYIRHGQLPSGKNIAVVICCDRFMNLPIFINAKKMYKKLEKDPIAHVCCDYLIKEVAKTFVGDHLFDLCEIEGIDTPYDSLVIKGAAVRVISTLQQESYGPALMAVWAKSFLANT